MAYSFRVVQILVFLAIFSTTHCFVNLFPGAGLGKQDMEEKVISGQDQDKIALLSLEGVISDESPENFFGIKGESMVSVLKESLKRAERDKNVKGIILKINSPGGTVTASDIIYNEIVQFRKRTNVPVMTVFMDVGASGAYYIAMGTDLVTAHPTTVTGSIGVVLQGLNVKEGLDKIGVKDQSITSGQNKAIGSPLQELSPEQRLILQGIVDSMYERFFSVVVQGRPNLSQDKLRSICDGRIFTGTQALKLGLVDQVGYFEDFVPALMSHPKYKKTSGNNFPKIVTYVRGKGKVDNIYQVSSDVPKDNLINRILHPSTQAKFYYIWSL